MSKSKRKSKVIVFSCGYNCEKWVQRHVKSVLKQKFDKIPYILFFVDDGSEDNTFSKASGFDNSRIVVARNKQHIGLLASLEKYLPNLTKDSDDIIILLDGHTWFSSALSIHIVHSYHQMGNWLTYGCYIKSDATSNDKVWTQIHYNTLKQKQHRQKETILSKPISFRSHLMKNITSDYFKLSNGEYIKNDYEMCLSYPFIDMVPQHRIILVDDVLSVKNVSYDEKYPCDERQYDDYFRGLKPLDEIDDGSAVKMKAHFVIYPVQITDEDRKRYGGKR